jgi:hypothetical protein
MLDSTVSSEFNRLRQLYEAGFHSAFLDTALRKIVDRQIERDRADLDNVNKQLAQFEAQHGLTSDEFWQRYQAGQTEDSADFLEWNAFYKMRQRIMSRMDILLNRNRLAKLRLKPINRTRIDTDKHR